MRYRPEIDGLRAVAIVPVVLFHSGLTGLRGGHLGVDVFFVLSGYLITSILLTDLDRGRFSLRVFYERRARRIMPALAVMVAVTLPMALAWMPNDKLADYGWSVLGVALFASNFVFWKQDGYFTAAAEEKPLLHSWSLAVEEQYYLVFPVLLALAWRFLTRRQMVALLIASLLASLALAQYMVMRNPMLAFYATPTRMWELLAGALCAFAGDRFRGRAWLADLGLAIIAVSLLTLSRNMPVPSLLTALPVAGTALVILGGTGSVAGRLLSARPVVAIGLISYSTYLWHQPLLAFLRLRALEPPGPGALALAALASFGIGWLSWRYVERPFRQSGTPAPAARPGPVFTRSIFAGPVSAGTVFAGTGAALTAAALAGAAIVTTTPVTDRETSRMRCNYGHPPCFARTAPRMRVVLWGDSYADAFIFSLGAALAAENIELVPLIKYSCPPILGLHRHGSRREGAAFGESCRTHNQQAIAAIRELRPDFVVMTQAMHQYLYGVNEYGQPAVQDPADPGAPPRDVLPRAITATLREVGAASGGIVYVLPHPVNLDFDRDLKRATFGRMEDLVADPATMREALPLLRGALQAAGVERIRLVEGERLLCGTVGGERPCPLVDPHTGQLRLYDGSHVTQPQARLLAREVVAAIQAASAPATGAAPPAGAGQRSGARPPPVLHLR